MGNIVVFGVEGMEASYWLSHLGGQRIHNKVMVDCSYPLLGSFSPMLSVVL